MKRTQFSEVQIIGMLKEKEVGLAAGDVCRAYGISSATFYKLKLKFRGLEVSGARRLRKLHGAHL
jgi:putative transposase